MSSKLTITFPQNMSDFEYIKVLGKGTFGKVFYLFVTCITNRLNCDNKCPGDAGF